MRLYGPPQEKETLSAFVLKYKGLLALSSVAGILYNTAIVLGPIFLGRLIDASAGNQGDDVWKSALTFIGVTILFQFLRFVKRWFMRDHFNRVACDLRQTLTERILTQNMSRLMGENAGDLMSRTVGDITIVVDAVMTTVNEIWDTWLLMLSYFIVLLMTDWRVTLLASIMVPITIWLAEHTRHILYRLSLAVRESAARSSSGLQRYLVGVFVLRLFGREKVESEKVGVAFQKQTACSFREIIMRQALLPIYALLAGIGIVIAIRLMGERVALGTLTIGAFNAYIMMFVLFTGRTKVAAQVFNLWHSAKAAWGRVKEKMHKEEQETERFSLLNTCSHLTVRDLSFAYGDYNVLHGVHLTAEKGQIVGITGPIGSGKTTLAKAITGLYPYTGNILLNGKELSNLTRNTRSSLIAYSGHDPFLFSMSLKENILLGEREDKSRLQMAIDVSALSRDVKRLDKGLQAEMGEKGVRVSGGQRQRIALARAVYADTDILILDDPFSSVDLVTEKEILAQLRRIAKTKIILLFTHRLTAFTDVDQIYVMNEGRIIDHGSHETLMRHGGLYEKIYSAQAFMEGDER